MSEIIFWFVFMVLTGAGYILLLYLAHKRDKGQRDSLNRVKAKRPDLYTRVQTAIKKAEDNPKEEKDWRDYYVLDRDKYKN